MAYISLHAFHIPAMPYLPSEFKPTQSLKELRNLDIFRLARCCKPKPKINGYSLFLVLHASQSIKKQEYENAT